MKILKIKFLHSWSHLSFYAFFELIYKNKELKHICTFFSSQSTRSQLPFPSISSAIDINTEKK